MITIREVVDRDLIPLSEFLPKGFSPTTKEFWLPQFEWWWSLNPAYTPQMPRGWVLEKNGSILGFIGNIPVKYLVHGEERIAAASNSWYVDPSVRGIFSFIIFNKFLKKNGASLFLFKGEDNKNIMNILSKYKFEEYILPLSQKEYVLIIDKGNVIINVLSFVLNYRTPKLSNFLEYSKRVGSLLWGYLYQKPIVQGSNIYDEAYFSSVCTSCDDSFSTLWKPYLNTCDVTISRDTKTLNWLYFSSARFYKRVVIQCKRSSNEALAGYMVFDLMHNKKSEVVKMYLVEMCIENNDPRVLASLTSFAIEIGKQNRSPLLVLSANSPETEKYFRSTITMTRVIKNYRYIKFSDSSETNSDSDTRRNVCLSLIYPPQ
jgi:hypothetical protein